MQPIIRQRIVVMWHLRENPGTSQRCSPVLWGDVQKVFRHRAGGCGLTRDLSGNYRDRADDGNGECAKGRRSRQLNRDREFGLDLRSLRWRVKCYREDTMDLEMLNESTG